MSLVLDRVLVKPSLTSLPPVDEGGLLQVRMLSIDPSKFERACLLGSYCSLDKTHEVQNCSSYLLASYASGAMFV